MTANVNENLPGSKCQSSSAIQRISRRIEKKKVKPIEVEKVKEQEVEKILNKKKERAAVKYLVQWKRFTAENNNWKREENLKNAKEIVENFEGEMEIRKQEKLELAEEKNFRRAELPGRYMAKLLYRWNNGKFEQEYLRKLERNQWN